MRYSIQLKSIDHLEANATEVLIHRAELRVPLIITQNVGAKAVPQNLATYEETQETLALLKIPALGNKQVEAGRVKPVAELLARLRATRANGLMASQPSQSEVLRTKGADRNSAGTHNHIAAFDGVVNADSALEHYLNMQPLADSARTRPGDQKRV